MLAVGILCLSTIKKTNAPKSVRVKPENRAGKRKLTAKKRAVFIFEKRSDSPELKKCGLVIVEDSWR